jgi:hypothetical protein
MAAVGEFYVGQRVHFTYKDNVMTGTIDTIRPPTADEDSLFIIVGPGWAIGLPESRLSPADTIGGKRKSRKNRKHRLNKRKVRKTRSHRR